MLTYLILSSHDSGKNDLRSIKQRSEADRRFVFSYKQHPDNNKNTSANASIQKIDYQRLRDNNTYLYMYCNKFSFQWTSKYNGPGSQGPAKA